MKVKQATEIVKNINLDSITDEDKLEALDIVTTRSPFLIPKTNLIAAVRWLLEREEKTSPKGERSVTKS